MGNSREALVEEEASWNNGSERMLEQGVSAFIVVRIRGGSFVETVLLPSLGQSYQLSLVLVVMRKLLI